MVSSRIKNNIYALTSLSVIILTIISFILMTGFMVDMNKLVFNIGNGAKNDNGSILDISGYNEIKGMFETGR